MSKRTKPTGLPELVIKLHGGTVDRKWRARIHIPTLMEKRPLEDLREFVKRYCAACYLRDTDNLDSIQSIHDWFTPALACTRAEWEAASKAFVEGYKAPPIGKQSWPPRHPNNANNNRLQEAVIRAKHRHERLIKRQEAFDAECRKYQIPIV